jgi:radical SAM protein with 4Fe4S-binding SPASM domain
MKVRLEITTRCNLNCMHCSSAEYKTSREWTTEEAEQAFDDMISNGVNQIDFLGGEPFCRKDMLELFLYLDQRGIETAAATNGLLLDENTIDVLVNLRYLNGIFFSIDGASREIYETIRGKNNYENVLNNLKTLVSRKRETDSQFKVGLNFVVNGINASETGAVIALADRFDLDAVYFGFITWVGNAKKNRDTLYVDPQTEFTAFERAARKIGQVNRIRRLKGKHALQFSVDSIPSVWKYYLIQKYPLVSSLGGKFQCLAGRETFLVDASGVMYPCEAAKIHIKSIEQEIGTYEKMSLPEHTFEEIKNSRSFRNAVAYIKNKKKLYENVTPCNRCPYSDGCSVCPLYAKSEKTIDQCNGEMIKVLSETNRRYIDESRNNIS